MYRAEFFFDAGSGTVLWSANDETRDRFDYPIELDQLPISEELRGELVRLVEEYDTSLDWDYPPDPTPWSAQQCDRFTKAVRSALARLQVELREDWEIVDEFDEVSPG
jgi:hypothetical protein